MENPLPPTPYQYQVGGSLKYQHPTYVVRQADSDLYEGLKNGEFCYVLNSRQMGKSSLRVQMMKKLKEQGIKCASIDMTRIGSHVTPGEWYAGVISELLRGFGLSSKVNFRSWWCDRDSLPPLQRLRELIEDVLLAEFSQNLVIFIDEIDCILKVKFKDDFFGFIRACYNQRVDNSEYQRLTFCLLGVATPSDLIADKQRTPFNIGQSIELTGFKLEEAILALTQGLAQKVDNPKQVVKEVLAWTGGQPFLTQKLCQLVVEKAESRKPKIDQLIQKYLINNWQAQDEPEHLKTIRDRLLSNEQHNSRVLGLYQQILQQGEIAADENPEQIELRLSGMVVKQEGYLRVYNRIYQAVFDLSWVEKELAALRPYSEAKNILIERKLYSSLKRVLGDSARLQQVVWNLLSNAVKFTPKWGNIEVRLEFTNSHAQIRVSDTGAGIKSDILPYVFDIFYQADDLLRKPGGFGLGLRTVRYLVELHGGTVHAESSGVGQGATFIVNLPIMGFSFRTRLTSARFTED